MSLLDVHANIPYFSIAPLIGMEPTAKYSVSVECPYCGSHSFAIHQDNTNLEEWYFCSQCKANGSVIALAAEKLDMPETEVIQYLAEQLEQQIPSKAVDDYFKACELKNKYLKFWAYAKKQLLDPTPKQIEYLKFLGWQLRSPMSFDRLWEGPASLYGLSDPHVAEKYLGQMLRKKPALVILPFYRTPSIISGFACLSYKQTIYTNTPGRRDLFHGEPGFAGLQFLNQFNSETLVATSMLKTMVQLQMHHFSTNIRPLPLLGWCQCPIVTIQKQWSLVGNRQLILWEKEPTAAVLHQARMCNASVTFLGPNTKRQKFEGNTTERWRKWVKHDPAIDMWRKIVRTAKPYEQALKNWARIATPEQKVKLLQDAEQYEQHTAELVRSVLHPKLSSTVAKRIRVGQHRKGIHPGQSSGFTVVLEKDNKWYTLNGKISLSGTVRVSHIVVRPSGAQEYIGTLYHEQQAIPFRVPKKEASLAWLKAFGLKNGVRLIADFHRNFHKFRFNPFEAAMQFETPEVVVGLERIGWDGAGFQLYSARVLNGVFHQNPEFTLPVKSPGPKQHYCTMRKEVKKSLSRTGVEMEITWATAIALCAQVTAPAVDLTAYGIVFRRRFCDSFLQNLYNRFEIRKGPYVDWQHKWPRRLDSWKLTAQQDQTGFFVTQFSVKDLKSQELLQINAWEEDLQPRAIAYSADKIILHYLRWFSANAVKGDWSTWVQQTRNNLEEIFPFVPTGLFDKAVKRITVY